MDYEWDPDKAASNEAKHGISFDQARTCFPRPGLDIPDSRKDYGEIRINRYGRLADDTPVVVTYTRRTGRIRIISARKAKREERELIP